MSEINYKDYLERYHDEIREKIVDIQKRMYELNSEVLALSIYIQSGIFNNCIAGMKSKIEEVD